MIRLNRNWLSSQILLLVIVGWVCGLGAIHHFWLEPSIQAQISKQESSASVRWIEQSLTALAHERRDVDMLCERLAALPEAAGVLNGEGDVAALSTGLDARNFSVAVCDRQQHVAAMLGWMNQPSPARPAPVWRIGEDLHAGPIFPATLSQPAVAGLASFGGRTCLFARRPIGPADKPLGFVVLVRAIDYAILQDLSDTTGVTVMVFDSPLGNRNAASHADIVSWCESKGTLSAESQLKDSLGRPIGRLQVTGSVIDFNASSAQLRSANVVQLLWLIGSALFTFALVYVLFIRPLAILVRRLSDRDLTSKRDRLAAGLFAETGILARKFGDVMDRIVVLSETDALTGLTNRRQCQILLDHEFNMSRRHNAPLAFLMLDVDHFKQVNDKFGHLVGDEVLQMVAKVIKDACRKTDVAGRFGGEEFSIVLPRTSMDQAAVLGERIRAEVAHRVVMHEQDMVKVTISVGVASMPQMPCQRAEDLVEFADQALYCAKHEGRNRTVLASQLNADGRLNPPAEAAAHPLVA